MNFRILSLQGVSRCYKKMSEEIEKDWDQTHLGKSNVLINEKLFGFAFSFTYFLKNIYYFKVKTRSFTFQYVSHEKSLKCID